MTVLVCGDRNWTDEVTVELRLRRFPLATTMLHGGCRGADLIAAKIATKLGCIDVREFPADWATHGKAAGPIRNRQMLDQNPDLVIAFHPDLSNSRGTRDTVEEARRRGIKVEVIDGKILTVFRCPICKWMGRIPQWHDQPIRSCTGHCPNCYDREDMDVNLEVLGPLEAAVWMKERE